MWVMVKTSSSSFCWPSVLELLAEGFFVLGIVDRGALYFCLACCLPAMAGRKKIAV